MSLPKQVQRQLDVATAFDNSLTAPVPTEPTPPTEPVPQDGVVVEPSPAPAPVVEPPKDDAEVWKQRYKSLQGIFDAEVPKLQREVAGLKERLAAVETKTPAAPQPAAAAEPYKPKTTAKDVEAFGGDLVDLIERKATDVAAAREGTLLEKVNLLEADNAKLRETVGSVAEKQGATARQTYFTQLAQQVPDYEAINADERFLAWLGEVDQLSGLPRQAYLSTAFDRYDVPRTVALFNTFKKLVAPPPAAAAPAPAEPPAELRRQVAPPTSKAAPTAPAATEVQSFSRREVEKFYADISKGVYRGRDAERTAIETQIDLATAQGRIT